MTLKKGDKVIFHYNGRDWKGKIAYIKDFHHILFWAKDFPGHSNRLRSHGAPQYATNEYYWVTGKMLIPIKGEFNKLE